MFQTPPVPLNDPSTILEPQTADTCTPADANCRVASKVERGTVCFLIELHLDAHDREVHEHTIGTTTTYVHTPSRGTLVHWPAETK